MQCSCGPDWYTTDNKFNNETYVMFLFCFCFSVPFSTIVFCYSQLLLILKSVGLRSPRLILWSQLGIISHLISQSWGQPLVCNSPPTGSEGPSWVCLHPEGRAGGDQDGGRHGAGLPGVLDALRLLCSVDDQQSGATLRPETGHHTFLSV